MTCDCCDPTADSGDPVVARLERDVSRLEAIVEDRNEAIAVFQDVVERNNVELKRLRGRLAPADAEIDRLQDIIRTYPDSHICPSCGGPCIGCECVRKRNKELAAKLGEYEEAIKRWCHMETVAHEECESLRTESQGRLNELVRLVNELEMERGRSVTLEHDVARYEAKWRDAEATADREVTLRAVIEIGYQSLQEDNTRLRGLLWEACEAWSAGVFDKASIHWKANRAWHDKATAALEGKQ